MKHKIATNEIELAKVIAELVAEGYSKFEIWKYPIGWDITAKKLN